MAVFAGMEPHLGRLTVMVIVIIMKKRERTKSDIQIVPCLLYWTFILANPPGA